MAPVAITARFPLGVYHGHASDGSPDPLPSPARLFSALVAAAHTGTSALPDGGPSANAAAALAWLEEHPPSGLRAPVPMAVGVSARRVFMYRRAGTLVKRVKARIETRTVNDGYAIEGRLGWVWDDMPDPVRDALGRLCEDVPHLGEADSPVVLELGRIEPDWRLDPGATAFTPGGLRLRVADTGRTRILQDLHTQAHPERPPTPRDDSPKANELIINPPTSEECTRMVRYAPVSADDPANEQDAPWRDVLILQADDGTGAVIAPERRLGWCVAFHRALVSRIGDGAPAVVTGRYPEGTGAPANRLAIHYLPAPALARSTAAEAVSAPGAFLVMLPSRLTDDETTVILRALAGMTRLRSRWGQASLRPWGEILDARRFWAGPGQGLTRLWSPTPVAVPEVTRQRGAWGFEDAILLSLGFVWRDALSAAEGPVPKGAQGYRALVARVRRRGAGVMWYRRHVRRPSAYAHRMPPGMVAQPYTALLSTGELCPDTGLAAIGQSRHLGGGLLVPADLPAELVRDGIGDPR